jgi:2-methylcitrate dehydratase PrpD
MSGVDALLALRARHDLEPDDIESMTHWVRPGREKIVDDNPLKSHNAQYILSVAAVHGKVTPDFILTDQRADPRVARLYRHVRLLPEPAFAAQPTGIPAAVEVVTRDGRRLREEVRHAKGFPENPLSDEEIRRKFLDWSTTRISRGQAERIIDLTDRLEEMDDAADLVGRLAADPAG